MKITPDYYGKEFFPLFGTGGRRIIKKHATRQRRNMTKNINDDYTKDPGISIIDKLKWLRIHDMKTYGW